MSCLGWVNLTKSPISETTIMAAMILNPRSAMTASTNGLRVQAVHWSSMWCSMRAMRSWSWPICWMISSRMIAWEAYGNLRFTQVAHVGFAPCRAPGVAMAETTQQP